MDNYTLVPFAKNYSKGLRMSGHSERKVNELVLKEIVIFLEKSDISLKQLGIVTKGLQECLT